MTIKIRDANMKLVDLEPARLAGLRTVLKGSGKNLDRIDVWPQPSGAAQIGLSWFDGRSAIFDFPSAETALKLFNTGVADHGWPAPKIHIKEQK